MASLQLTLIDGGSQDQQRVFNVHAQGCSIGRSKACDWVLHDSDRFISNKHFLVSYRDKGFYLTDLSSNGVYVNDNSEPVGTGNTYALKQSDTITLGKFKVLVSKIEILSHRENLSKSDLSNVDHQNVAHENVTNQNDLLDIINPHDGVQQTMANSTNSEPQSSDLGLFDILNGKVQAEPIEPSQYSQTEHSQSEYSKQEYSQPEYVPKESGMAFGQSADSQAIQNDFAPNSVIPDDWDVSTPEHTSAEIPIVDANANQSIEVLDVGLSVEKQGQDEQLDFVEATAADKPLPSSASTFFDHIYDGLNLPVEYKKNVDQAAFAQDLVKILNTSTQGIMALLAGRSVFKQESRLDMTMIKPQSNNPIKFSLDPSDTFEMLLVKKRKGYLSAEAAYIEAFNDVQTHQMAFISGLQATLKGIMEEMHPQQFEAESLKQPRSFISLNKTNVKWEAFVQKQTDLQDQINQNINEVLATYFSGAYEEHVSINTQNKER